MTIHIHSEPIIYNYGNTKKAEAIKQKSLHKGGLFVYEKQLKLLLSYNTCFTASRVRFTLGSITSIRVGAYGRGKSLLVTRPIGASR